MGTTNTSSNSGKEHELPERFKIEAGEMGKVDLERMKPESSRNSGPSSGPAT
jgi:hypothetical protein